MTVVNEGVDAGLDPESVRALREILEEPALPVATTASGPGPRVAALREALDHLGTVGALAVTSAEAGARLLRALADLDAELTEIVRGHVELTAVLRTAEPGRARNTVLGNTFRGDLLTAAVEVRRWSWTDGTPPSPHASLGRADGELTVGHYPGLYDYILAWEPGTGALIAVPTYRDRISWAPDGPNTWVVRLAHTTFHQDDLIPIDRRPQALGGEPAPPEGH
ncbi:hypothetical protein [Nocardia bovistercoris]|uniref:Uncharacterized protein n=1 Tax=Nocardia bovistercoris TaxID=2785916 RepID=A0A931IDS3_9NOCA|nr:hypothetical protein [Nocardia bovistercoris]MBH0779564.1 hypothetical protein [Nocardia bovistercoris]